MTSKTIPEQQVYWDNHIKAYLSSGLSMKKYCERHELVYHRFQYQWDRYRRHQNVQPPTPQQFSKIEVKATTHLKNGYELRCPNGVVCTLPPCLEKDQALKIFQALLS